MRAARALLVPLLLVAHAAAAVCQADSVSRSWNQPVRPFRTLRSLPCDVFLAPHGSFFALGHKMRRLAARPRANPFVDPDGCRSYIDYAERTFSERLRRQAAQAARGGGRS